MNILVRHAITLSALLFFISCGDSAKHTADSKLAHVGDPFEVPNSWKICNQESYDLYLTLAHDDYSGRYWSAGQDPYTGQTATAFSSEIHGWIPLPRGTCTDVGPVWRIGTILLRSSEGAYEPRGAVGADSGTGICVNTALLDNKTIPWTAIMNGWSYMRPYLSCPSGTVLKERYIYTDLPGRNCARDPNRIDCSFTLSGGAIRSDGDRLTLGGSSTSAKLDEKIKNLKANLATAKGELTRCQNTSNTIVSKKILELDPSAFDDLANNCGGSDTLKKMKQDVESIQKEIKDAILVISQSLDDIYRAVLVIAGKLGVATPLDDDFNSSGITEIVYPSPTLDPKSPRFYASLFERYQPVFDESYASNKKRLLVSVLGFTYTMPIFGRSMASEPFVNQDRYLDFKASADRADEYFSKIDFNVDDYGYPIGSPVPDEVKRTIRDDIKPHAPAQAMALDSELKKWEGTLTDKQRYALEAVRALGAAFHQAFLVDIPNELAVLRERLTSVADGAIEAIKDVSKCLVKVGVSGDFADWYEITVGKDYCSGEDLTVSGRIFSAAGLALGSAKAWRAMASMAGVSVVTRKVFQETEHFFAEVMEIIGPAKFREIRDTPKGARKLPSSYLPKTYIEKHLANFENGGSYLVPEWVLDTRGRGLLGREDGLFISTPAEIDRALKQASGNISELEKILGIEPGKWLVNPDTGKPSRIVRVDIKDTKAFNLRMPTGNEGGANSKWLPGGILPDGKLEAVIDQVPLGKYVDSVVIP